MQINKRQLKKWIAALDSGEYKQTQAGKLQHKGAYCCLGVACRVLVPDEFLIVKRGIIFGGFPNSQPRAPKWLKEINDHFDRRAGIKLSTLNDHKGYTFREIATLLELVYIHKILD